MTTRYSKRLSRPFISGDTDKQLRESLFKDFVVWISMGEEVWGEGWDAGRRSVEVGDAQCYSLLTQGGNTVNTILITRTGDESLNLPVANVVIQTSFHHGANNQEMQRLGLSRPPLFLCSVLLLVVSFLFSFSYFFLHLLRWVVWYMNVVNIYYRSHFEAKGWGCTGVSADGVTQSNKH